METATQKRLLTMNEAAGRLGLSASTVCRIVNGKAPNLTPLPCVRVGRRPFFRPEALDTWIRENEECKAHSGK